MKIVTAFVSYMLIFMIMWILLDILWTVVIEKGSYIFTIIDSLFMPVIVGIMSWFFSGPRRKAVAKFGKSKSKI